MFEYNADTPTSLLEAAVVQWQWLEQIEGLAHRDNSIGFTKNYSIAFSFIQQQTGLNDFHFSAMQEAGREDWAISITWRMWLTMQVGIFINLPLKM